MCKSIATICNHVIFLWVCNTDCSGRTDIEGVLPKGSYLSCVSMAGRAHFGRIPSTYCHNKWRRKRGNINGGTLHWLEVQCQSEQTGRTIIEGILPKGPYLPCVSMEVRALFGRIPSNCVPNNPNSSFGLCCHGGGRVYRGAFHSKIAFTFESQKKIS